MSTQYGDYSRASPCSGDWVIAGWRKAGIARLRSLVRRIGCVRLLASVQPDRGWPGSYVSRETCTSQEQNTLHRVERVLLPFHVKYLITASARSM